VPAFTIVTGIPIGLSFQSPEPKSAWRWSFSPIDAIIVLESAVTGRWSTRWFQTFQLGKMGQLGAPGSGAAAVTPASASAATAMAARP